MVNGQHAGLQPATKGMLQATEALQDFCVMCNISISGYSLYESEQDQKESHFHASL